MTVEKVLKLDNIQYPEDLAWRRESYDSGHPKCLCSACGQPVKASEDFLEHEDYYDTAGNPLEQQMRENFPVRVTKGKGKTMVEAVVHTECYNWLTINKGLFK
jgi:hypothetical protein